jgi:hypothetical protein
MRFVIVSILLIVLINNCYAIRGVNMMKYVKNTNKAIYNVCNNNAYIITNNTEMYNCIRVNQSNNCRHLDNFNEYQEVRLVCVVKYESEIGYGLFLSLVIWMFIGICCSNR